jgi:hypothetical protein
LFHWADFLLCEWKLGLGVIELSIEVGADAGQGALTVAPFLGVFFVALEWERG